MERGKRVPCLTGAVLTGVPAFAVQLLPRVRYTLPVGTGGRATALPDRRGQKNANRFSGFRVAS